MDHSTLLTNLSLAGAVLFGILWYRTPKDSYYETVEMEVVSKKKVFLHLALVCFCFWLAFRFYFIR